MVEDISNSLGGTVRWWYDRGSRLGGDAEGMATLRTLGGASRVHHAFQTASAHARLALGACVRRVLETVEADHTVTRHLLTTERTGARGAFDIPMALLTQLATALTALERGLTFHIAHSTLMLFLFSQLDLAHGACHGLTVAV